MKPSKKLPKSVEDSKRLIEAVMEEKSDKVFEILQKIRG